MNKKEWQKYNKKIVNKGKLKAREKHNKDFIKNNHIKLLKNPPARSESTKIYKDKKISDVNVKHLQRLMLNGILKSAKKAQKIILDFDITLKGGANTHGNLAIKAYYPTLHINVCRKIKSHGYIYSHWYKDVLVINPSIYRGSLMRDTAIKSASMCYWFKPFTQGYLTSVVNHFLDIPVNHRQMNWIGHYYISKE